MRKRFRAGGHVAMDLRNEYRAPHLLRQKADMNDGYVMGPECEEEGVIVMRVLVK